MGNIVVTVFKDRQGVYPSGKVRSIPKEATLVGTGYLSMVDVLEGRHNTAFANKQLLKIDVPGEGYVYVDETIASFNDKVGRTNNPPFTFRWLGGTDVPAGNVITNDALEGISIASVTKGGIAIYHYIHNPNKPASLNIEADGGLAVGEIIEITYK